MWYQSFKGLVSLKVELYLGSALILGISIYLVLAKVSIGLSMGGLPVSDASGWSSCARSLGLYGVWPANDQQWCFRRPIYPILNSVFFRFFQDSTSILIIWNIFFAMSVFIFWRLMLNIFGRLTSLILVALITFLWVRQGATQFMSEQAGIVFGLLAAYFFWKYLQTHLLLDGYTSLLFISISQVIRPGNISILLFLPALLYFYSQERKKIWIFYFYSASFLPFAIVKFVSWFRGLSNFMSSENSWATLYGLSKNNSGWDSAYSDLGSPQISGEVFWTRVRSATLENIFENPLSLVLSIKNNSIDLLLNLPDRFLDINLGEESSKLILFMTLLIVVNRFLHIRSQENQRQLKSLFVLALILLGSEVFVYSIVLLSDPVRTMSTTFPLMLTLFASLFASANLSNSNKATISPLKKKIVVIKASSIPVIFLLILTIAMSTFGINSSLQIESKNCVGETSSKLLLKEVPLTITSEIRTPIREFWWQEYVSRLPDGLLLQGIVVNKNLELIHENLFFPGLSELPRNRDYLCVNKTNMYNDLLSPLSFYSAEFTE